MTRDDAIKYVGYWVDDAGNGGRVANGSNTVDELSRLVGWQCGFEPMVVAVWSYLPGIRLDDVDAIELATDYLLEIGWLDDDVQKLDPDERTEPNYVI